MSAEQTSQTESSLPTSTYRLQLHAGFTLRRATELVPYLRDLGISHIYASPLLKACPGSTHGYDVCDHAQINPEIGSEEDLAKLVTALRDSRMGLVLDTVPNHMGICGRDNAWWWDVLKNGRTSSFADFFDIDWDSPDPRLRGKILLPVLGDYYGRVLDNGELRLVAEHGELLLAYHEHRFPIAPASEPSNRQGDLEESLKRINADPTSLDEIIQQQHYRLAGWKRGNAELNYRRFFDIPSLAGIRVELRHVFDATHGLLLRWYSRGWIDGFRIDHPDGLYDPTEYLERLRAAAPKAWIVAEKILQPGETVPDYWPVAGTTGYDFIRRVTGLFVDPEGEKPLTDVYAEFTGEPTDYGVVVREKQRMVLQDLLQAEVNWLTRLLVRAAANYWKYRDLAEADLREALVEVTTRLPVYCTYVQAHLGHVPETDATLIRETISWSRQRRLTLPPEAFEFIGKLLMLDLRGEAERQFVMRFQQLTGPTMAKGAEDTACYCFNRLIALNTVGGDPSRFSLSPDFFHDRSLRALRRWPHSMLATSTHDTKRSGDVRMRLCLLSEIPQLWSSAVVQWSTANQQNRTGDWPDRNLEYFYYQTLVGAWPITLERAWGAMQKAAREAKQHTSWTRPNPAYEEALRKFVTATLNNSEFTASLERFVHGLVDHGRINSLSQSLLKFTTPGIPDLYQGEELWDLSLVDPDNRRPVDFELRQQYLEQLSSFSVSEVWEHREQGLPKLWLTCKTLRFRRNYPELFGSDSTYEPLYAHGEKNQHVIAFQRTYPAPTGESSSRRAVVIVVPRLVVRLANNWGETALPLPEGPWQNELTGETFPGGEQPLAALLKKFPVALLSQIKESIQ